MDGRSNLLLERLGSFFVIRTNFLKFLRISTLSATHPMCELFVDPEATAARVHRGESEEKVVPPPKKVESSSKEESPKPDEEESPKPDEEEAPKPVAKAMKGAPTQVVAKKTLAKSSNEE
jgi:hypothetical protein